MGFQAAGPQRQVIEMTHKKRRKRGDPQVDERAYENLQKPRFGAAASVKAAKSASANWTKYDKGRKDR